MKTLGIDFGLINFGFAISKGSFVEPLGQLKVKRWQDAVKKTKCICQKNKIEKIVVGLPEGKLKNTVIGFSRKLKEKTNLPIVFQPEDFTSKEAVKKMIEAKKPLKKRQKQEHIFSACIILQSYLDESK